MSLDSIKENVRHKITTIPIAFVTPEKLPPTKINGAKAAIVVNTPIVAGVATLFAPATTVSTGVL